MSEPGRKVWDIRRIAGPGVPGMEKEPPVYHLDIASDALAELISDPVGFLREAGLGPEQGVAPDGVMAVRFTAGRKRWTGTEWVDRDPNSRLADSSCCWMSEDEMHCQPHWEPE